ncbi:MAG: OmpA family protein, partial [Candidatus Eisenbacteria bacterium]
MACRAAFRIVAVAAVLAAAAAPRAEEGVQGPDEGPVATFLVPDVGLFFVRYGEPGAVRIESKPRSPVPDSLSGADDWKRFLTDERIARIFREEYEKALAGHAKAAARPSEAARAPVAEPRPPVPLAAPTTIVLPPAAPGLAEAAIAKEGAAIDLEPEEVRDFVRREFRYGGLLRTNLVIFETDKSALLPYSYLVLGAVGDVMIEFPKMRIRVEGHADLRGSDEYNLALSKRRA